MGDDGVRDYSEERILDVLGTFAAGEASAIHYVGLFSGTIAFHLEQKAEDLP